MTKDIWCRKHCSVRLLVAAICLIFTALSWSQGEFGTPLNAPQRLTPHLEQEPLPPSEDQPGPPLTPKQKQDLLKSNFEKLKKDAADLAAMAKSLQQDIDASNENVLSLHVVDKAEKIEKLARKIKTSARGT